MDGYLTKPVDRLQLFDTVEQTPRATAPLVVRKAFDAQRVLSQFGDDVGLLRELGQMFISLCPQHMAKIRAAIDAADSTGLAAEAHTLKGSAVTLGAEEVRRSAEALERLARAGQLDAAHAHVDALELLVQDFITSLGDSMSAVRA
jgi:HPt (histidine-containing phosphotransfer) domain-containing protein